MDIFVEPHIRLRQITCRWSRDICALEVFALICFWHKYIGPFLLYRKMACMTAEFCSCAPRLLLWYEFIDFPSLKVNIVRVYRLHGSQVQHCTSLSTSRVSRSTLYEFIDFTGLKINIVRVYRLHGSQGQHCTSLSTSRVSRSKYVSLRTSQVQHRFGFGLVSFGEALFA